MTARKNRRQAPKHALNAAPNEPADLVQRLDKLERLVLNGQRAGHKRDRRVLEELREIHALLQPKLEMTGTSVLMNQLAFGETERQYWLSRAVREASGARAFGEKEHQYWLSRAAEVKGEYMLPEDLERLARGLAQGHPYEVLLTESPPCTGYTKPLDTELPKTPRGLKWLRRLMRLSLR